MIKHCLVKYYNLLIVQVLYTRNIESAAYNNNNKLTMLKRKRKKTNSLFKKVNRIELCLKICTIKVRLSTVF